MSYFRSINQAVTESLTNSSTTNLAQNLGGDATGLDTFIGTSISTLGVNAIQVGLKTDKNCTVWVEQSNDSSNWDLIDTYRYYTGINLGVTTQAISSYVRTKVRNLSDSSTTYFRLSTVLCPIVEALPRSLTPEGNLKTAVYESQDHYSFKAEYTPMGEIRAALPYRLSGGTFTGTSLDSNYWTDSTGTGGSIVTGGAQCILSTGTTNGNDVSLKSVAVARYVGGAAMRFRSVMRLSDAGLAGNVRRWGAFDATNGCYFQMDGTTAGVVTLKDSTATVVNNGNFNGVLGTTLNIPTEQSVKTYEIYWTNSRVIFVLDDEPIHTVSASFTTWSSTLHLPIRFENNNGAGVTTNVAMNIRSGTIYRLGRDITAPRYKYIIGNGNTTVCKIGPGVLHSLIINDGANGSSVSIYDNATGAGTIIGVLNTANVTSPTTVEFNCPFYNGLTIIIASTVNISAIYE